MILKLYYEFEGSWPLLYRQDVLYLTHTGIIRKKMTDSMVTVAIVEDDFDVRELMCSVLLVPPREVFGFESAEQLDNFSYVPTILISDYALPGEDGIGLVKKWKKANPDLIIIMYTGLEPVIKEKIANGEFGGYEPDHLLAKPADMDALEKIVSDIEKHFSK